MKVAVLLAGCGHLDGAEIRESVLALLSLDQLKTNYKIFASNYDFETVNHLTGKITQETRNALVEAARIARGDIEDVANFNHQGFDSLLIIGGFGVAKNLSDIALKGADATIRSEIAFMIQEFYNNNKKIGAICIAPALVALALKDTQKLKKIELTLGDENKENKNLIEGMGATYKATKNGEIALDMSNKIVSCAAYMRNNNLASIYNEIRQVVGYIASS